MNGILGSFPNSYRQIEPELLRIIISSADYDNFEFSELWQFRKIFFQEVDDTVVGNKPFPGEMLTPYRIRITLPNNVYRILTDYYNDAYGLQFATIAELTSTSSDSIIVSNIIDQFAHIRISAKIFGLAMAS
ncbi:hypothetical protein RclHR1_14440008 [Rhizophagus clarus]|uniref:Uncharacterized protein n=1 Tax=Rhizophagus clarus TaxID=94130 RepID=A0A2Z6QQ54_9GLOM|nr:hypothetical protein RclHR1_14440008 [Rhizophagus clarus]